MQHRIETRLGRLERVLLGNRDGDAARLARANVEAVRQALADPERREQLAAEASILGGHVPLNNEAQP